MDNDLIVHFHEEYIECPRCRTKQWGRVEHFYPFFAYVHNCEACDYTIIESEWDQIYLKRSFVCACGNARCKGCKGDYSWL